MTDEKPEASPAAGDQPAPESKPADETPPAPESSPVSKAAPSPGQAAGVTPGSGPTPARAEKPAAPPGPVPPAPTVEAPPPVPDPPILAEMKAEFGDAVVEAIVSDQRPTFVVKRDQMVEFARALRDRGFDYPGCITGVDWPNAAAPENSYRETVYHLMNTRTGAWVVLKARCPSSDPWLYSLSLVYRGADWPEREVYDMYGIDFHGHLDLRRILMPEDWTGHPLLKDYRMSTYYTPVGTERQK